MLDKIILIHPTKCAGTTISERLFKLKGFSDNDSAFYSGYSFNRFFQNNIQFFYFIFNSRNLVMYFIYLLFYCVCFYFTLRNLFSKNKYGLTFADGSIQHFTYKQWGKINKIMEDSVCISIVTHPQHRMVSSFYFLGYDKHCNFLEFLQKIQDGSLLSEIPFVGFRGIIKQHLISMYDCLEDKNGGNKMDFIFKRESLDNDWKEFCAKYLLEHNTLKYINKTKSIKDWKDLYKIYPEATQLVYELYKKDFEHFGYKIIAL
tara:strand:+ start:205 stop:984 length:780 start_codon:yes stop_codon:yes gene_type:complete